MGGGLSGLVPGAVLSGMIVLWCLFNALSVGTENALVDASRFFPLNATVSAILLCEPGVYAALATHRVWGRTRRYWRELWKPK